jgi:putative ABC transport system ATP-binding protein
MAEPIVRAVDVVKVYDTGKVQVRALRGVSLSIDPGEMVAIVGPSGCGKTTLLNVLSGLDDLTSGDAFIDGEPLKGMSDRRRTRYRAERMGFVFQFFNLLPVLSAAENVELPLLVAGVKPHEARQRAREALAMVGLAGEDDKRPSEVSGGQQQRVSIARALVNQPAIVWGDEPTGSLDSENSAAIMGLLRDLNREHGQTFVLVTHDPTVAQATDRIIRMRDGHIEDDGLGNGLAYAGAATGRSTGSPVGPPPAE